MAFSSGAGLAGSARHHDGNVVGVRRLAQTAVLVVAPGWFPIPRPPKRCSSCSSSSASLPPAPPAHPRQLGRRLPARPVGPEAGRGLPRPSRADRSRRRRRPRRRRRAARVAEQPDDEAIRLGRVLNTVLAAPLEDERDIVRNASHELGKPPTLLIARVQSALRNAHSCAARDHPARGPDRSRPAESSGRPLLRAQSPRLGWNGRLLAHFDAARQRRSAGAKSRFSLLSDETRSPSTRRKPRARADFRRVTQ